MKIAIKQGWQQPKPIEDETIAFLKPNTWDDHGFKTTFRLELILPERVVEIGNVSIAFEGMTSIRLHEPLQASVALQG